MKKFIYGTIFGLIISGSIVYAANYLYKADEVSYDPKDTNWSVDNVDSAIKELYNKINEANSALLALKNTNIAKAVGANGDTFSSVINKLGEITNQGNKSFTVSNTSSITIPAGYYNGQGTINVSGLVPAPTGTFTPSAHGTQIDMGANNTYRYINTTNVWNQAVAAADARANTSSANYQAGYNAGYNAANPLRNNWSVIASQKGNTPYTWTAPYTGYYLGVAFMTTHEYKEKATEQSAAISTTGSILAYVPYTYPADTSTYTKSYASAMILCYCTAGQTITFNSGGSNVYHDNGWYVAFMN